MIFYFNFIFLLLILRMLSGVGGGADRRGQEMIGE